MSDQSTGDSGKRNDKKVATSAKAKKNKPPVRAATAGKKKTNPKKKTQQPSRLDAIKIFTGLLVVATVATVIVVAVPQRANLDLDRTDSNVFAPGQPIRFTISVHNYGGIFANVTAVCGQFGNVAMVTSKRIFLASECIPLTVVVPNEKTKMIDLNIGGPGDRPSLVLSDRVAAEMKAGKRPTYFFGRIDYRDAYSPIVNPFGVMGPSSLEFCVQYLAKDNYWIRCTTPGYGS